MILLNSVVEIFHLANFNGSVVFDIILFESRLVSSTSIDGDLLRNSTSRSGVYLRPIVELLRDRSQLLFPSWILRCHDSQVVPQVPENRLKNDALRKMPTVKPFLAYHWVTSTEMRISQQKLARLPMAESSLRQSRIIFVCASEARCWGPVTVHHFHARP